MKTLSIWHHLTICTNKAWLSTCSRCLSTPFRLGKLSRPLRLPKTGVCWESLWSTIKWKISISPQTNFLIWLKLVERTSPLRRSNLWLTRKRHSIFTTSPQLILTGQNKRRKSSKTSSPISTSTSIATTIRVRWLPKWETPRCPTYLAIWRIHHPWTRTLTSDKDPTTEIWRVLNQTWHQAATISKKSVCRSHQEREMKQLPTRCLKTALISSRHTTMSLWTARSGSWISALRALLEMTENKSNPLCTQICIPWPREGVSKWCPRTTISESFSISRTHLVLLSCSNRAAADPTYPKWAIITTISRNSTNIIKLDQANITCQVFSKIITTIRPQCQWRKTPNLSSA